MKLIAAISVLFAQAVGFGIAIAVAVIATVVVLGAEQALAIVRFLTDTRILQAILGGWIAHNFQASAAQSERDLANLQVAYQRKTEAISGLSSLIQRRIYSTRRYLAVIRLEPDKIESERDTYRQIVSEWNSEAITYQNSIIVEFGYFDGAQLDTTVFPIFADLDRWLRGERLRVQAGHPSNAVIAARIDASLAKLSVYANSLNRELISRANQERIILDGPAPISHENYRYLSYPHIIKALVKLPK